VTPDVAAERDDPSTMWVSDAEACELERKRQTHRLALSILCGAVIVVTTLLFAALIGSMSDL
jgi:hypothetical protein